MTLKPSMPDKSCAREHAAIASKLPYNWTGVPKYCYSFRTYNSSDFVGHRVPLVLRSVRAVLLLFQETLDVSCIEGWWRGLKPTIGVGPMSRYPLACGAFSNHRH
jgi:hypothetical protein